MPIAAATSATYAVAANIHRMENRMSGSIARLKSGDGDSGWGTPNRPLGWRVNCRRPAVAGSASSGDPAEA